MTADLLILDCHVATMEPATEPGGPAYGAVEDAAVLIKDGKVVWVGSQADLPTRQARETHWLDGRWVTPGLIDCHTHLVFGGDRSGEFEKRLGGATYEEIARAGGGIVSSVAATRAASEDQLYASALRRLEGLKATGVTTVEIKSGYGLDADSELKMLRVARRIGTTIGITVRTTCLSAHAVPPEFAGRPDDYIEAVSGWLPILHAEGLVDAVDAFCERIAFSAPQVRRLFDVASALGLPVKLHADQLSDGGGAALVAAFHGLSADHVEYSDEDAVAAMAAAGTVAVFLPGSFHCLRETQRPPIDAFRRHGVPMAVSTDLNPGTSPVRSLPLAMGLACTHFRLTPEEALRGATHHAATALGLDDRGRLVAGLRADIALWPVRHPAELAYWIGDVRPTGLWAAGRRLA